MNFKKISIVALFSLFVAGTIGFSLTFFYNDVKDTEIVYVENLALGRSVTASSNAHLAQILVDGQELPNVNWYTSWNPPQVPSRPSWVTIDLGKKLSIQQLAIILSVAAYEGIYDIWAPPDSIVVETGDSPDTMRSVAVVPSNKIPENGENPGKRRLEVHLKDQIQARYVKLLFPTGGKLPSMPNVIGLGGIRIYGPKPLREKRNNNTVVIEDNFGRAVIDVNAPQMLSLFLREPSGELAQRNLLSGSPRALTLAESKNKKIFHRKGAYTYVLDKKGQRFESRLSPSHTPTIQTDSSGKVKKVILTGIRLQSEDGIQGPVEEDWVLEKTPEGMLSWTISQRWLKLFNVDISGTPGIYLSRFGGWGAYRDHRVDPTDPQITSTVWYDPVHLKSSTHPEYETYSTEMTTEFRTHTIDVLDSWAIYKFFTNFHLKSDLHLSVKGGYLFRRAGVRNDFNEIGSTINNSSYAERRPGDKFTITITISPKDKFKTGEQLLVTIPDPLLENTLRDLHASVLNGGVISDPKRYDFGNGTEDANYAGSANFQALALSVSTALGALANHPHNADKAFKGHLERILATVNKDGLTCFGFNSNGKLLDDNLHVISAARTYVIKTGDREFVDSYYPTFEKIINYFIKRIDDSNGLFRSPEGGAHWYYDGINFSGFNTYYQAFLYKALVDLAEMAEIIGKTKEAALWLNQAQRLAENINTFLWFPDAPGGPRYADWIDNSGKKISHFIDICQYPLIVFGIAPPDRAETMLATADKRLAELKRRFGHSRSASLSLLWPLSPRRGEKCFGTYFYGGSILASTYWEVLARTRAGHVDGEWGAYRLLQNFAKRFAETSFVGSNSLDIRGNISLGGDEGYLADMLLVPASLIHGILGVTTNWKEIKVSPTMPLGWTNAKTSLMWKGRSYDIKIEGNSTNIIPKNSSIVD